MCLSGTACMLHASRAKCDKMSLEDSGGDVHLPTVGD